MVLVALAMVAIIAMAALSIDVITLYLAREEAQRSADAGALAAARVISMSGMTGDPGNTASSWQAVCGGSASPATVAAVGAATQTAVGGAVPTTVNVTYSAGGTTSALCETLPAAFGVNPMVTVQLTRTSLPTFFSRIWGNPGNNISATATAEAFNSSNSGNISNGPTGTITPVQPRCVKPWLVPNLDPLYPAQDSHGFYCNQLDTVTHTKTPCNPLVSTTDGSITHPGISLGGTGTNGVIGETFYLSPDCTHTGSSCTLRTAPNPPGANFVRAVYVLGPPNLQFVPGQAPTTTPAAVPSCASGLYQQAIAGCDQSTVYQCGVQQMNTVDLSENPDYDTAGAVQCLIHQADPYTMNDGQDAINNTAFPFQITAGSASPLFGALSGNGISSSSSIVSLPIYDPPTINTSGTTQVTIIGFLQVFINVVDQYGNVQATVLNVAGCGNGNTTPNPAVTGSSPVPIRLITPQ